MILVKANRLRTWLSYYKNIISSPSNRVSLTCFFRVLSWVERGVGSLLLQGLPPPLIHFDFFCHNCMLVPLLSTIAVGLERKGF